MGWLNLSPKKRRMVMPDGRWSAGWSKRSPKSRVWREEGRKSTFWLKFSEKEMWVRFGGSPTDSLC